ncbi:hypothetical protein K2173_026432 [Erythroxylum novogranatense]|uniref:Uncharacterized protein n=1 Tax=Erythroxylum novogranatense TaxID=1862640 RepID=A0AAV8TZJ0_9ROSI|nr:hypothetical protein K2173_026432 [Erythroxylum novogranatense]
MATSAFKSTTGRTPVGKSSTGSDDSSPSTRSSSGHRRSRSLSRFSRPFPVNFDDFSDEAPPKGRFVNETRGSGVSDVSFDDLAVKFFDSTDRGGSVSKFNGRVSSDRPTMSQRRGGRKVNSESNLRRRRSVSVVRYQISDSESDADQIQNSSKHANVKGSATGNKQRLVNKTTSSNHGLRLKRSMSQKDLKYHDGYSSHSSVLTDDEGRDAYSKNNVIERTIRAVYAQKKPEHLNGDIMKSGLYEAMRKELRHAVKEITMELEQTMGKTNDPVLAVDDGLQSRNSTVRRSYVSQMEQELSQIIKELVPDAKNTAVEKSLRTRKRSNDRKRMSKRLGEEAERYIEDFISNFEDTDISSLDGERSDTSSTLGGSTKTETLPRPATSKSVPVHTDGVFLPWLKWETCSDSSPLSSNSKEPKATPKAKKFWNTAQDSADLCNLSVSSRVNWSPGITVNHSASIVQNSENKLGGNENYHIEFSLQGTRSKLDIAEYLNRQNDEDFLFERWNQQQRIHSGNLLLCNQMFFLV